MAAFAEFANRQPGDAAAQVSIGIIHSRMGALDAAEAVFKAAIALDGAEGDAALKLGGLYVHQRRLRAAVQVFKEATVVHPHHAELFASLGDVYRQLGLLAAAVQSGEEAVRLEPERALWRFHLASTYERLDPTQARAEWRVYVALAEDDERETQRLVHARSRLQTLQQEER